MLYLETTGYGYSKKLCRDVVNWFISEHLSKYKLDITVWHRGLNREGVYGYCDVSGATYNPREFLIEMNTHMGNEDYIVTLLHELYHVLQFVKGDLKLKSSKRYFRGECIENLEYKEQPHEIAARYYERVLYYQYISSRNRN